MSTINLSPKNPLVLAVLGIGAFWMLTQRRASAATLGINRTAAQSPTAMGYLQSPSSASRYAAYGSGSIGGTQSTLSQGLSLASQVLGMFGSGSSSSAGIATGYRAGTLGTGVSAEADGNIGEAAAREFYSTHADDFVVNPPVITQAMQDAAAREGWSEY